MQTNLSEIQAILDELKDDSQAMANEKVRTSVEQLDTILDELEIQDIFNVLDTTQDAQQSVNTLSQWTALISQIVMHAPQKETLLWSLHHIAQAYENMGERERAFALFEQMFELTEGGEYSYNLRAEIFRELGLLHFDSGQWSEAEAYYQKSLVLFEANNDIAYAASIRNGLGYIAAQQGDYNLAKRHHQQVFEVSEGRDDCRRLVAGAQVYADKALAIFDKTKDAIGTADVYKLYGCIHRYFKKWDAAIEAFTQSISGYQSCQNPQGEAEGCYEFGRMYLDAQNSSQARYFLRNVSST